MFNKKENKPSGIEFKKSDWTRAWNMAGVDVKQAMIAVEHQMSGGEKATRLEQETVKCALQRLAFTDTVKVK